MEENKRPEDVKETQGGPEGQPDEPKAKAQDDNEKVQRGEKDPSEPQVTMQKKEQLKTDAQKPSMQRETGKLENPDEQFVPARNDPYHSAAPDVLVDPTATGGLDRDQSLGFTTEGPTEGVAQTQVNKLPDAPHREPSNYTPSGARPGQQNPVNPQGSPGSNPLDPAVGARPNETQVVIESGRDGDYTKQVTPGEKNPSQRGYEIDSQPTTHNDY